MDYKHLGVLSKYARDYCHERIRRAGITDTEHKICAFLSFHPDVHQDMIASALELDKTTIAKALTSLESRDMIRRFPNPANRRKNIISITETGQHAVSDLLSIYDDWFSQVASCLNESEQEQFANYCHRLLGAAEKLNETTSPKD